MIHRQQNVKFSNYLVCILTGTQRYNVPVQALFVFPLSENYFCPQTHSHTHTYNHTHSHTLTQTHSHTHTLTHTYNHTHTHTHTHTKQTKNEILHLLQAQSSFQVPARCSVPFKQTFFVQSCLSILITSSQTSLFIICNIIFIIICATLLQITSSNVHFHFVFYYLSNFKTRHPVVCAK
jgi:hypothetical protein